MRYQLPGQLLKPDAVVREALMTSTVGADMAPFLSRMAQMLQFMTFRSGEEGRRISFDIKQAMSPALSESPCA